MGPAMLNKCTTTTTLHGFFMGSATDGTDGKTTDCMYLGEFGHHKIISNFKLRAYGCDYRDITLHIFWLA